MKFKYTGLVIIGLFLVLFLGSRLNLYDAISNNETRQLPASTVMKKEEMQEDIDFMVAKIMAVHPQTHSGRPQYLAQAVDSVQSKITGPLTAGEFYFLAATVSSSLKDAHTSLYYGNTQGNRVINLPLIWLKRSLCVIQNTDVLLAGDEIVSIGSKSVADIFKKMSEFIPAENEGWVRARAARTLVNESILRHLGLINLDNTVTVTYLRDKKEKTVNLPLQAMLTNSNQNTEYISYTFYEELSLGVFRFDKCIYDAHFKNQVKQFFKQVREKEIKNVAIDVRQNTGGNSQVIDELISYLRQVKEIKNYSAVIRYSKDVAGQRQGMWRTSGLKEYQATVVTVDHAEESLQFNGDLYILTSNQTFSSGNWIAVMAHDNEFATLIGEPTGNAPSSFGDVLGFKLPNSGYHLSLSFKKFQRPEPANDPANTLTPDIIVYTVAEDIRNNRDPQMEALLELLSNKSE